MSLQISESSLNFSEDLSEISEIFSSSDKMPGNFPRTIFTRGVPPARATVSKPYTERGRLPESERGDVVIDINETMRGVPSNSRHLILQHLLEYIQTNREAQSRFIGHTLMCRRLRKHIFVSQKAVENYHSWKHAPRTRASEDPNTQSC